MKRLLLATLPFTLLLAPLAAQDPPPPKHLRFITLGELPVWKETLENGIRKGQEFPPGSVPPKTISVVSGESSLVPFRGALRRMSDVLTIDGKTPILQLKKGEVAVAQPWMQTKIPTAPLSLGVLFRDPATMTWNNPKMLLVKDDQTSFPAGNIRFVNVSDIMVILQIGDWDDPEKPQPKIFGIPPGKTSIKPLKVGKNPMRVGYTKNGEKIWIWSNQIRSFEKQRVQAFFYKAQGEKPRSPVLFQFTPEDLPQLPKPPANR